MQPELLKYSSLLRTNARDKTVFDPLRKKFVAVTPEELVRQLLIIFLNEMHLFPLNRMSVERKVRFYNKMLRYDLAVHDDSGNIWMLCELKAPDVEMTAETCLQLSRYNLGHRAPFLLISNGLSLWCWKDNGESYVLLDSLPAYPFTAV